MSTLREDVTAAIINAGLESDGSDYEVTDALLDILEREIAEAKERGRRKAIQQGEPMQRWVEHGRELGRAEVVARVEAALPEGCDDYLPPQTCITAGIEALAADGCVQCRVRAALDRPATTHRPETTTDAREANPHG